MLAGGRADVLLLGRLGERHGESGAAARRVVDDDRPVVIGHGGGDDGETETGATLGACTARVETCESFEDPFAVLRCNAGTVIVDGDHGQSVVGAQRDGHLGDGVTNRVVEQVPDKPRQRSSVTDDAHGPDRNDDRDPVAGRGADLLGDDVVEIDLVVRDSMLVESGKGEQVVDERVQSIDLAECGRGSVGGGFGVPGCELEGAGL